MSSVEPDDGGGEIDGREEIASCFVVACGDSAELFEFAEEILDQVPRLIKLFVVVALDFSVAFRWDDGRFSSDFKKRDDALISVIALIGKNRWRFDKGQKKGCPVQIASLPRRRNKARWIAQGINGRIDLGAQSAFAASDGLVFAVFFWAPALC